MSSSTKKSFEVPLAAIYYHSIKVYVYNSHTAFEYRRIPVNCCVVAESERCYWIRLKEVISKHEVGDVILVKKKNVTIQYCDRMTGYCHKRKTQLPTYNICRGCKEYCYNKTLQYNPSLRVI